MGRTPACGIVKHNISALPAWQRRLAKLQTNKSKAETCTYEHSNQELDNWPNTNKPINRKNQDPERPTEEQPPPPKTKNQCNNTVAWFGFRGVTFAVPRSSGPAPPWGYSTAKAAHNRRVGSPLILVAGVCFGGAWWANNVQETAGTSGGPGHPSRQCDGCGYGPRTMDNSASHHLPISLPATKPMLCRKTHLPRQPPPAPCPRTHASKARCGQFAPDAKHNMRACGQPLRAMAC